MNLAYDMEGTEPVILMVIIAPYEFPCAWDEEMDSDTQECKHSSYIDDRS